MFYCLTIFKETETPEDDTEFLRRPAIDEETLLEEDEHLVVLPLNNENFTNVDIQYYIQYV